MIEADCFFATKAHDFTLVYEDVYFSIVDVVQVLTESADGRKYWNKLKQRLKE